MSALFDRLYAELAAPVLGHVRRKVGDQETAEDICQEVWSKLADRLDDYAARPDFNGPALVYRAATNKALDHLRRGNSVAAGGRVVFAPIETAASAPAPDPSPEEAACAAERRPDEAAWLAVAYLALPRREARVVWMREVEQRSYEDIAAVARTTVPAVKSLLYRARERQRALAALEARSRSLGRGIAHRFWRSVDPDDRQHPERCWRWIGRHSSGDGSAMVAVRRSTRTGTSTCPARRVAYALTRGPLAPWANLSPRCGHRWCVNPDHQRVVVRASGRWGGGRYRAVVLDPLRLPPPPSGAALRARRLALGVTQRVVALAAGWPKSTVSSAECGSTPVPPDRLLELTAALDRLERERAEGAAA